ncbi:MAG: hypothetical protein JEZ02_19810 [Desulfatibacillum sp.]|nr:hypothetical protein [Desulfatibacillum sp.]
MKLEIREQGLLAEAQGKLEKALDQLQKDIAQKRNLKSLAIPADDSKPLPPLGEDGTVPGVMPLSVPDDGFGLNDVRMIQSRGLTLKETTDIGSTLRTMATEVGLSPESIRPDVTSLMGNREEIVVDARVAGSFKGLWMFLYKVGSHPAFKEFVNMSIREIPESREMNVRVRFLTEGQAAGAMSIKGMHLNG